MHSNSNEIEIETESRSASAGSNYLVSRQHHHSSSAEFLSTSTTSTTTKEEHFYVQHDNNDINSIITNVEANHHHHLPNIAKRTKLFNEYLEPVPNDLTESDFAHLAVLTKGFCTEDIQKLCHDISLLPNAKVRKLSWFVHDGEFWSPCRETTYGAQSIVVTNENLHTIQLPPVTMDDIRNLLRKAKRTPHKSCSIECSTWSSSNSRSTLVSKQGSSNYDSNSVKEHLRHVRSNGVVSHDVVDAATASRSYLSSRQSRRHRGDDGDDDSSDDDDEKRRKGMKPLECFVVSLSHLID